MEQIVIFKKEEVFIMSIMIMLGHMTPKVAIAAPRDPFSLQPMKVAVFTAMTPGVHWPMAK